MAAEEGNKSTENKRAPLMPYASFRTKYTEAMGDPDAVEDEDEGNDEEEEMDSNTEKEETEQPTKENRDIGKLNARSAQEDAAEKEQRNVGKLDMNKSSATPERSSPPKPPEAPPVIMSPPKAERSSSMNGAAAAATPDEKQLKVDIQSDKDKSGFLAPSTRDTPKRRSKKSPRKTKDVGSPARQPYPDQQEWRKFVQPDEGAEFPAAKGRYHLYASYACPGSHRALIVRALKGLQDTVSVSIVHPTWRLTRRGTPEEQRGWVFGQPHGDKFRNTAGRGGPFPSAYPGNLPDPVFGAYSVRDIYEKAGDTAGKYTVPFLWDLEKGTIVNNESSDIAYMLNSSFNEFAENASLDLYTEDDPDPQKLTDVIEWLSPLMIHGVYRCGFAKSQAAYNKAIRELTAAFDKADDVLQKQRYLTGNTLTDADIRLFVTLLRFDEVYAFYFRANTRLVMLTPTLLNFCREIYQMNGVAETCNMEQIKAHFYSSHAEWNKFSIIPKGLGFMRLLRKPHNRDSVFETIKEEKKIDLNQ